MSPTVVEGLTARRGSGRLTGPTGPLHVRAIRGKGRGIVAGRRFSEGELIERIPVIVIPSDEWELVGTSVLSDFCFSWGVDNEETAIALGHGSLFNHSYDPNAFAELRLRQRLIEFTALRDIDEGEEITINYNGDPDSTEEVGFPVR
ncbi:MAG TPA: SET domain-containing protein [Acidimicrobiales bacterium]|nr:SET domain-containing protein [Acidimicrobiales bacterium]